MLLTVKDTLLLISLKKLPLALNTLITPFLPISEAVLGALIHVFSCNVVAVLSPLTDSLLSWATITSSLCQSNTQKIKRKELWAWHTGGTEDGGHTG